MPDRILLEVLYENPIDREIPEIYMDKRIEVRYTPKEEYDRAGSRDAILRELDSDIVIFMVQTAIPQNRYLVEKLTEPFKEERTAVVYGRHMTDDECSPIECCVRQFNYPPKGMTKSLEDTGKLGIRTFFNSNVCAAYRRSAYLETEGFGKRMIAGEDMSRREDFWKRAGRRFMRQRLRFCIIAMTICANSGSVALISGLRMRSIRR